MYDVSLQQNLGATRSLQISYVGNKGVNLLRSELLQPSEGGSADFAFLTTYFNHDYSNYNSAQVQFKQQLSHHLQALFSYTWSHALDNGSSLALPNPYHTVYNPDLTTAILTWTCATASPMRSPMNCRERRTRAVL